MTFIQIYNKIETITLLNFLSEKKIEEKMKNLLFYVGMRVKKGPEILMLKHIFEKNGLNKNLIKKSIAHQPTEQKKLITKIFFHKEGRKQLNLLNKKSRLKSSNKGGMSYVIINYNIASLITYSSLLYYCSLTPNQSYIIYCNSNSVHF